MPAKPPRLRYWRERWHVVFTDPLTKRERRISCGDRNATECRAMLREYADEQADLRAESRRLGGRFDYSRPLTSALADYLRDVGEREKLRHQTGSREGLSYNSARQTRQIVADFTEWLAANHTSLTTGALDAPTLQRYFRHVAGSRSSARANVYRRTLRAALVWLSRVRPRLFPDFEDLRPAFKQAWVEPAGAIAYTPDELNSFRKRLPPGQRRVFDFLALTGCRLGELDNATLEGNRLRIMAAKTGRERLLALTGAPECEVAPKLLKDLKRNGLPGPWERKAWERAGDARPQKLRRNYTSYTASLGVPATDCAL